ncbi:hypothetical protein ABVT39_005561 [Epinephelus coioides]
MRALIGCRKDRAGMRAGPIHPPVGRLQNNNNPFVVAHAPNEQPDRAAVHGIRSFMFEPESEPEPQSDDAEVVEETHVSLSGKVIFILSENEKLDMYLNPVFANEACSVPVLRVVSKK